MTISRVLRLTVRPVLDFALPPRCPGCGAIVDGDHRFCMACWGQIEFLGKPSCVQCALPLPFGDEETRCAACISRPPAFDRAFAATSYGELTRRLALKLKYGTKPATALTMAKLMARNVVPGADALLVPVPLHRWRIWRRGYNQAALIGAALSRQTGVARDDEVLRRIRSTPPLKAMSQAKRSDAVRGVFAVNAARLLAGRKIMLVDDIFTTGSTADACAKALKKAGAASVELHVWARVVRPSHVER